MNNRELAREYGVDESTIRHWKKHGIPMGGRPKPAPVDFVVCIKAGEPHRIHRLLYRMAVQ